MSEGGAGMREVHLPSFPLVIDGNVDQHYNTSGGRPLNGTTRDQLFDGVGTPTNGRAYRKQGDGGEECRPAPPDIGHFAPDRGHGGTCQQSRGADPEVGRLRLQLVRDGRDGRGDDGKVEGGEKQ
ncbi:hypothetical protein RBB50_011754 [Rhinocladiella similis]